MNREDIIRMAREAGAAMIHGGEHALMGDFALQTFFKKAYAAGAAAEREKEKERQRYDVHSCGPDCDRYICVAARNEREGCAKAASVALLGADKALADRVLRAIRARNNT